MNDFRALLLLQGTFLTHKSGQVYQVGLNIVVDNEYVVIPVYSGNKRTQDIYKNFEVIDYEVHQSN